jgi:ABC-type branched-subunit amino acid transport system substrate-binding protein
MRRALLVAVLALTTTACGGSSSAESSGRLVIAVDVPLTGSPYVAQTIKQGVELAASNLNGAGGLRLGSRTYRLTVKTYDNHLSARRAVENTRSALRGGAVAIVTDGTGVDATWQLAERDDVAICITYDGGTGLVNEQERPNVFRIAPTNHGIAFRYAEYLIPKKLKVGMLSDDELPVAVRVDVRRRPGRGEDVRRRACRPAARARDVPVRLRARAGRRGHQG